MEADAEKEAYAIVSQSPGEKSFNFRASKDFSLSVTVDFHSLKILDETLLSSGQTHLN